MGYAHNGGSAPSVDDVVLGLPDLPDRVVLETVRLGEAYHEVRSALLALSGVALMHHLGMGDGTALAGVAASAHDCLERARTALARALISPSEAVRGRATMLARTAGVLEGEATSLARRISSEPDHRVLQAAAWALSEASAPVAGIRYLTSSSCAVAVSARRIDGSHGHDHAHGHHHDDSSGPVHPHTTAEQH